MMSALCLIFLSLLSARTLTLDEAVRTAETNQPALHEAQANTQAGNARAEGARAPVLPQVKLGATYQRTTGNREHKPNSATTVDNTADTFNWWDFTAAGSFVLWDFGQTRGLWHAAEAAARGLAQTESATRLEVILDARIAYFQARAQKSLVGVASESLANRERHLGQIDGFVTEGTRPQIDLAQARADRATARVQLIAAENAYSLARAALNRAMGVTGAIDYDVADQTFGAVDGEVQPVATLVDEALRARPDRAALDEEIHAQELARSAAVGSYGPTLSLVAGASDQGSNLTSLERRRGPQLQRIDRLDVVVPVEQNRRRTRRAQPLAVDDWVAGRVEQLHAGEADALHLLGGPLGAPHDVAMVRGQRADAGDREIRLQFVDVSVAVEVDEINDGVGHGCGWAGLKASLQSEPSAMGWSAARWADRADRPIRATSRDSC